MEPMNATAQVMPDACVVWAPTQNPGGTQATAARLTGLPPEKVTVHTTLLGGGFGRRGEQDFIVDAVETSKAVGAPRSEERRVGKECRSRLSPYREKRQKRAQGESRLQRH